MAARLDPVEVAPASLSRRQMNDCDAAPGALGGANAAGGLPCPASADHVARLRGNFASSAAHLGLGRAGPPIREVSGGTGGTLSTAGAPE